MREGAKEMTSLRPIALDPLPNLPLVSILISITTMRVTWAKRSKVCWHRLTKTSKL